MGPLPMPMPWVPCPGNRRRPPKNFVPQAKAHFLILLLAGHRVRRQPPLFSFGTPHLCTYSFILHASHNNKQLDAGGPHGQVIVVFQKLAIELLLNTTVINAYLVYKTHKRINSKRYTITKFREQGPYYHIHKITLIFMNYLH